MLTHLIKDAEMSLKPVHEEKMDTEEHQDVNKSSIEFKCSSCKSTFKEKHNLMKHRKSEHEISSNKKNLRK